MTMEKIDSFRKLISKELEITSDLLFRTMLDMFGFQTVFSLCSYSYRCCQCAFEHEFFLYIKDGTVTDQKMYERIERSIADGRCPHVRLVGNEGLKQTSIYGFHVAAAVHGDVLGAYDIISEIFQLSFLDIACVKHKYMKANIYHQLFSQMRPNRGYSTCEMLQCQKSEKNESLVTVSKISLVEVFIYLEDCAKLDNILSRSLYKTEHLELAINHALKNNLAAFQARLFEQIRKRKLTEPTNRTSLKLYFTKAAIMYNCPDILRTVIEKELKDHADARSRHSQSLAIARCRFLQAVDDQSYRELQTFFGARLAERAQAWLSASDFKSVSEICEILNRHECKEVFAAQDVVHEGIVSETDRITWLFSLLKTFYSDFKAELVEQLKQIPNIAEKSGAYLERNIEYAAESPHVAREIVALGAEIRGRNNLFSDILQRFSLNNRKVRETVKMLLSANPDVSQQQGVVEMAIAHDEKMYRGENVDLITGSYNTDAKEHGRFGYDGNDFVLNFAAPFLLECGFPISKIMLEDAMSKHLHPVERKYIQTYLDSPNPLARACRDTLRGNFRGKQLFEFLKASTCPKAIQNIILMKSVLN